MKQCFIQPQGWANSENEDWLDWCEGGPADKGTPRVQTVAAASYITHHAHHLRARAWATLSRMGGGAFFKYQKDIYTPAQSQVEVQGGAGTQLCLRTPRSHSNFNLSDWLTSYHKPTFAPKHINSDVMQRKRHRRQEAVGGFRSAVVMRGCPLGQVPAV